MNKAPLQRVKKMFLAHPKRLRLYKWLTRDDDCQTVGCIAGWIAALEERKPGESYRSVVSRVSCPAVNVAARARRILGVSEAAANRLFYPGAWPYRSLDEYTRAETYAARARAVVERINLWIRTNGKT